MFNFQQNASSVAPAIASQVNAQVNFLTEVSQKMIDATQQLSALNLQVAKAVLEEAATNTRQVLSANNRSEAFSAVSSQTQPTLEKVRAYQQHVQRIVTDAQADVAKSIQAYVPEATRATQEVVQTVAKRATEQTASVVQRQQDAVDQSVSAAQQNVNRAADATAKAVTTK
jgi:phasin family protein